MAFRGNPAINLRACVRFIAGYFYFKMGLTVGRSCVIFMRKGGWYDEQGRDCNSYIFGDIFYYRYCNNTSKYIERWWCEVLPL